MTDDESFSIIRQIAEADYNSEDERPSRPFARHSIELAAQPGHCRIDNAPAAIAHLGIEGSVDIYIDCWADCWSDEYADDNTPNEDH